MHPGNLGRVGFDEVTAVLHGAQQKGLYGRLEEVRILELISYAPTRPQHKRLFLGATLPEFPLPTRRSSSPSGTSYFSLSVFVRTSITSGRTLALTKNLYLFCQSHKSLIPVT